MNGEEIPIFLSDYVLASYGTGAIMAVPGHDQRDWEFAEKFGLPIIEVVKGGDVTKEAYISKDESAIMVNSGFLDGMTVKDAIPAMTKWLVREGPWPREGELQAARLGLLPPALLGRAHPHHQLPEVRLGAAWTRRTCPCCCPMSRAMSRPTTARARSRTCATGWSVTCPKCGGPAERETDTMPQLGRLLLVLPALPRPAITTRPWPSEEALDYWSPVDWYNGGMEHTTLHLLYSRFWHKFLYDIGAVPTKEPYAKRTSHGMILGLNPHNYANLSDDDRDKLLAEYGSEKAVREYLVEKYGEMAEHPIVKMSKSLGNVVNPDSVVKEFGADTLRLYIMFLGDFEKAAPWNPSAVKGCKRFLDRIWAMAENRIEGDESYSAANEKEVHRCIKKVSEDIENMKFNTAIAAMMTLMNQFAEHAPSRGDMKALLALLSPFAPHMAEELWEIQGFEGIASLSPWPQYDEAKTLDDEKEIAVQVNGKLRSTVVVPAGCEDAVAVEAALADQKVKKFTDGCAIVKTIVVRDKLVNIIVKPSK